MTARLMAVGLLTGSVLVGCGDPCARLAPPTPAEQQAAQGGVEVEKELRGGYECVVEDGRWQQDAD